MVIIKPTDSRERADHMKKGEKRKLELLKIAYRMFLTRGYENTSVDEIIEQAGIAKGTYYYYFESKEQMLEDVIGMMIDEEALKAQAVLSADIPIPQKVVAIVASFRPTVDEQSIGDLLNRPENALMHEKTNKMLIEKIVPLLTEVVSAGVDEGIFDCDNIPERVKIILIVSDRLFDEMNYSENDVIVFIDMIEKLLGAKEGTMSFVRELIS